MKTAADEATLAVMSQQLSHAALDILSIKELAVLAIDKEPEEIEACCSGIRALAVAAQRVVEEAAYALQSGGYVSSAAKTTSEQNAAPVSRAR